MWGKESRTEERQRGQSGGPNMAHEESGHKSANSKLQAVNTCCDERFSCGAMHVP